MDVHCAVYICFVFFFIIPEIKINEEENATFYSIRRLMHFRFRLPPLNAIISI